MVLYALACLHPHVLLFFFVLLSSKIFQLLQPCCLQGRQLGFSCRLQMRLSHEFFVRRLQTLHTDANLSSRKHRQNLFHMHGYRIAVASRDFLSLAGSVLGQWQLQVPFHFRPVSSLALVDAGFSTVAHLFFTIRHAVGRQGTLHTARHTSRSALVRIARFVCFVRSSFVSNLSVVDLREGGPSRPS